MCVCVLKGGGVHCWQWFTGMSGSTTPTVARGSRPQHSKQDSGRQEALLWNSEEHLSLLFDAISPSYKQNKPLPAHTKLN